MRACFGATKSVAENRISCAPKGLLNFIPVILGEVDGLYSSGAPRQGSLLKYRGVGAIVPCQALMP